MPLFAQGNKEISKLEEKVKEYNRYIVEHKNNVSKAFNKFSDKIMTTLDQITIEEMEDLENRIKHHDESKYSKAEFEPYRNWFYPTEGEEKNKTAYDKAWHHHLHNNPHHWQYWTIVNDDGSIEAIEMDEIYLAELFCDWVGMSYKFHNNPNDFYNQRKEGIVLAPITRKKLEVLLALVKDEKF